jgi:signal transduction histidine kinase
MRRQMRQLAARVESAREEERARISREVHDQFGQMLSALKLDFETLASRYRPRGAEARSEFDQRVAAIIRRITAEMRPAIFEDLGLAAALDWQLQEFESRTGIRCRRRGLARNAGLAAGASLDVFRIFQEILTNVIRHASATILEVTVETDGDSFTLSVSDNGKGFDPKLLSPARSLGLLSMRERATLHEGTVERSARRNGGTTVTVRLPRGAGWHRREPRPAQQHQDRPPIWAPDSMACSVPDHTRWSSRHLVTLGYEVSRGAHPN